MWIRIFAEYYKIILGGGVNIHGVDGDYVQQDMLAIEKDEFETWNLETVYRTNRKYDLAISTECAEHLDPSRADSFVEDLTLLSDLVLFSAAAPYQGGVHHVNEQPMSYWIQKFEMKGYEFRDVIRPDIWDDSTIATCYRQNLAMFVRKGSESYTLLDAVAYKPLVDVIHPDHWKWLNVMLQGRLGRIYRKIERLMAMLRSSFGR